MSGRLDGMVAVITGAASGIGAGTARSVVTIPTRMSAAALSLLFDAVQFCCWPAFGERCGRKRLTHRKRRQWSASIAQCESRECRALSWEGHAKVKLPEV